MLAHRRALSIGELVIATGLLALMIVTVMVLFGQMLNSTTKNALMSQGAFFAEAAMEREAARIYDTGLTASGANWVSNHDDSNHTNYLYRLDTRTVVSSVAGPPDDTLGVTYSIDVEVRWWQDSGPGQAQSRLGFGKLSLKRSRLVYVPR